jgi:hypothetical protein
MSPLFPKIKPVFLLSGLLLLSMCIIWFLPWRFQTNDDVMMMWLVSGAYTGSPESYAVFIHPLLSWTLSNFYLLLPEVNWYGLTWFYVIWHSGFLLFARISSVGGLDSRNVFWLIFVFITGIHLSFFPQFTLVAGFAAFAGLSTIFGERESSTLFCRWAAWIAVFFAIMIRMESAVLVTMGWAWYSMVFNNVYHKPVILNFLGVCALFLILSLSKIGYEQTYVDQDFLEFNKVRAKVSDHPVMTSLNIKNSFRPGSDWHFFSRWMFEELPLGKPELDELKRNLDNQFFSKDEVVAGFTRLVRVQLTELFKSALVVILVLSMLRLSVSWRKKLLFLGGWVTFFLVFNHFNLLMGRVNFLFFFILFFPILQFGVSGPKKNVYVGSSIILVIFLAVHSINFAQQAKGRTIVSREFHQLIKNKPKNNPVFTEGFFESNFINHFSWKNPVPVLSFGWISRSPFQKKAYQLRGFNKQSELKAYSLISFQFPEPLVFPDYMNRISSPFFKKREEKSPHLIRLDFEK